MVLFYFITNSYYYRSEYECFQIELAKNYGISEWKEDLRKVMMRAGLENQSTVFLFSDTQVIYAFYANIMKTIKHVIYNCHKHFYFYYLQNPYNWPITVDGL